MEPDKRLRLVEKYINRMPGLSTTVTKVLEICNNPAASPNDLNRIISLDPILTGQVLKLINSAYYSLPNRITSLTRAIIMLGINTVKNLVLGASILGSIGKTKKSNNPISVDDFWAHSLCVGVTAKALAGFKGISRIELEEYFMVGLLHDLGVIPLSGRFPEDYAKVIETAASSGCSLFDAEDRILGINHCEVGDIIAEHWKLTDAMKMAIGYHHMPFRAEASSRQITKYVALANIYSKIFGMGVSREQVEEGGIKDRLLSDIGISDDEVMGLYDKILAEIEKAKVFLQVSGKG